MANTAQLNRLLRMPSIELTGDDLLHLNKIKYLLSYWLTVVVIIFAHKPAMTEVLRPVALDSRSELEDAN